MSSKNIDKPSPVICQTQITAIPEHRCDIMGYRRADLPSLSTCIHRQEETNIIRNRWSDVCQRWRPVWQTTKINMRYWWRHLIVVNRHLILWFKYIDVAFSRQGEKSLQIRSLDRWFESILVASSRMGGETNQLYSRRILENKRGIDGKWKRFKTLLQWSDCFKSMALRERQCPVSQSSAGCTIHS